METVDSVILSSPVFLIMIFVIVASLVLERFFELHNIFRIISILLTIVMIPFLFLNGCSLTEMVIFLLGILLVHVIDQVTTKKKEENGGEQQ